MRKIISFFEYFKNNYGFLLNEDFVEDEFAQLGKYGFTDNDITIIASVLPDDKAAANGVVRFVTRVLMKPYINKSRVGGKIDIQKAKVEYLDFLKEDGPALKDELTKYSIYKRSSTLFDIVKGITEEELNNPDWELYNALSTVDYNDIEQIQSVPNIKDINTFNAVKDPLYVLKKLISICMQIEAASSKSGMAPKPVLKSLKEVKGRLELVLSTESKGNKYEVWQFMDPETAVKLLRDDSRYAIPGAKGNAWCLKDPGFFIQYGKNPKYKKGSTYNGPYENYILLKNGLAYVCFDFESMDCMDLRNNQINDRVAKEIAPVIGDLVKAKIKEYYKYDWDADKIVE